MGQCGRDAPHDSSPRSRSWGTRRRVRLEAESSPNLRPPIRDATLVYVPDPIAQLQVKHFLVQGRVQGVGFRWFVHREAAGIGLRGWVRNTPDGHVEIVAAGTAGQLDQLAAAIHQGSRGSRVDRVLEHPLEDGEANNLNEFQIEGAW